MNMPRKGLPVNPITNTLFTEEQFSIIIKKAIQVGLISGHKTIEEVLKEHGYGSHQPYAHQISKYELGAKISTKSVDIARANHMLAYFALLNDLAYVEKILYKNMENQSFDVNFVRPIGNDLPSYVEKSPASKKQVMKMLHQISKRLDKDAVITTQSNDSNSANNANTISTSASMNTDTDITMSDNVNYDVLSDPTFEIDHELEKLLLPDYLGSYNAVQACCARGSYDMLVLLMQFGADISIKDTISHVTPLHISLLEKRSEFIRVLLMYGADEQMDIQSKFGTPLEIANSIIHDIPDIYNILFSSST